MIILEKSDRTPLIIPGIPLGMHSLIAAYHQQLMHRVRRVTLYWEQKCDRILFSQFEPYYRAIAARLPEPFDPAELSPVSRHQFFVATPERVPNPIAPDHQLPGLSQLEQLLGITYTAPEPPKDANAIPEIPKASITTGDMVLDLIVDTYLIFEKSATDLIERYSADQIAKMLIQKCDRQRGAEALQERQAEIDKQWFIENEARIMQLAQRGSTHEN